FFVMIEGGSIDKQSHLMDADRMMLDTIEFDRAIEVCRQFANANSNTLVVVTADHECGGASIIGASRVTQSNLLVSAASGGGRNAAIFGGVMDNTDVFFKMMRIALGDAEIRQELIDRYGNPGIVGLCSVTPSGATLSMQGSLGGGYALEASDDLRTWTDLLDT